MAAIVFRTTGLTGMLCLIGAGLVTVLDIVLRAFGGGVSGVVDIVQLLIVATAFTAIPYAFFSDGHVSVDLLSQAFPVWFQHLLRALAAIGAAVVMVLILYYGWEAMRMQMMFGDRSQNLGIPMVWYWVPLLAGSALSVFACVLTALDAVVALFVPRGGEQST